MKSRARQFTATRDKNLSETYSNFDQMSRFSATGNHHPKISESQSSAFLKKDKQPVCVNCVNHKLIDQRRQKQRKERQRQQKSSAQGGLIDHKKVDRLQQNRLRTNKDIKNYNQRQAKRQLNSTKSDKQLDVHYLKEVEKRQQEMLELEQQVIQLKKQKQLRYRDELHQQCQLQEKKRKQQKQQKLKIKPQESIIKKNSDNSCLLKYQKDLKRQIQQDKVRKQQQKKMEERVNHETVREADGGFLKYSEYSSRKNESNPEIFEEMKVREAKVKKEKEEARKLMEQERQKQMKKAKQTSDRQTKAQLQKMSRYASDLALQVSQKKRQEQRSKNIDTRQSRSHDFQEQKGFFSREECGQCHHSVKPGYLTYQ